MPRGVYKRTEKTRKILRKAQIKRYENPKERELAKERTNKRWEKLGEHEKARESQLKRYEDPEERRKASERVFGEKNPNYNNKWTDKQKEIVRKRRVGKWENEIKDWKLRSDLNYVIGSLKGTIFFSK